MVVLGGLSTLRMEMGNACERICDWSSLCVSQVRVLGCFSLLSGGHHSPSPQFWGGPPSVASFHGARGMKNGGGQRILGETQ